MAISKTDGGYDYQWLSGTNKVVIKPIKRNRAGAFVKKFGLGDAIISLQMGNLPVNGIIKPVTGESTGQGLLPTNPFGLKRWYAMPENVHTVPLILYGYGGWEKTIHIPTANGGSIKEVQPIQIIQNGYGCEEIVGDAPRLNW